MVLLTRWRIDPPALSILDTSTARGCPGLRVSAESRRSCRPRDSTIRGGTRLLQVICPGFPGLRYSTSRGGIALNPGPSSGLGITAKENEVAHNFYLKICKISELKSCSVKFGTTCPSVIFLLATVGLPYVYI